MAERKFSPFPVLKQEKLPVYETLYTLTRDFDSIANRLQGLTEKTFPQETIQLFRLQTETLRAGIAHLLTGILHRRESVDWHHFGKRANAIEQSQNIRPVGAGRRNRTGTRKD